MVVKPTFPPVDYSTGVITVGGKQYPLNQQQWSTFQGLPTTQGKVNWLQQTLGVPDARAYSAVPTGTTYLRDYPEYAAYVAAKNAPPGWTPPSGGWGGSSTPTSTPAPPSGDMSPYFNAGEMLTAPMSSYEQEALDTMQQLIQGILSGEPYGHDPTQTPLGQQVESTLMSLLSGEFPEEYFQTSIADPTRYAHQEYTLPAVKEAFAGMPGTYWGGERATAEAKSTQEMEMGLAAIRGELGHQARQLALQAIGPATEFMKLPMEQQIAQLASVGTYMQSAALPRLIEQHALDIAYQEWIRNHPSQSELMQIALGQIGTPAMGGYFIEPPESPWGAVGQVAGSVPGWWNILS